MALPGAMDDLSDRLELMLGADMLGDFLLPEEPLGFRFGGKFLRGCQLLWRRRRFAEAQAEFANLPLSPQAVLAGALEGDLAAVQALAEPSAAQSDRAAPQPPQTSPAAAQGDLASAAPASQAASSSAAQPAPGAQQQVPAAAPAETDDLPLVAPSCPPGIGGGGPADDEAAGSAPADEHLGEPSPAGTSPRKRARKLAAGEGDGQRRPRGSSAKRRQAAQEPSPSGDAAESPGGARRRQREGRKGAEKPKALQGLPRPRVKGAKSPILPRFAFEWFRASQREEDEGQEEPQDLAQLVQRWKALSGEERASYLQMAQDDRERFDSEYAEWRPSQAEGSVEDADVDGLVDRRRHQLERQLAKADRAAQQARRPKPKLPPGHPEPSRSAYSFFCKEAAPKLRLDAEAEGTPAETPEEPAKGRKASTLTRLRAAWKELSAEELSRYQVLAAEDLERFQTEFEAWRKQQPDEGLGEAVAQQLAGKKRKQSLQPRLPRPRVPAAARINLAKADPSEVKMDDILAGAAAQGREEERAEKRRKAREQREAHKAQESAFAPAEHRGGLADAAHAALGGAGADAGLWSGAWSGVPASGSGTLPVPQGAPAAFRPETSVDELLGGLVPLQNGGEDDDGDGEGEGEEDYEEGTLGLMPRGDPVNEGALLPRDALFEQNSMWSGALETAGAPKVLGPQLRLDESGNIVLDSASLLRGPDTEQDTPLESRGPVREAVSQYASAYRRTPSCKWSDEETEMFYEALTLYGTDLFLVQTFFRNKSAAQIKAKYARELRREPKRVEDALTTRMQPLTKDTFERLHGKIDTTKHYQPPPSPLPGEEPEPDGSMPAQEEPPPPEMDTEPPEPEYSAEDESLTTNRLMALFD